MRDNLHNKKVGAFGENLAIEYLIRKGYKILKRNYCIKGGEIDIIAQKSDLLIFVEVKTRLSLSCGYPEEAISASKIRSLIRASSLFLARNKNFEENQFQFDCISIILNKVKKTAKIKHLENIVEDFA